MGSDSMEKDADLWRVCEDEGVKASTQAIIHRPKHLVGLPRHPRRLGTEKRLIELATLLHPGPASVSSSKGDSGEAPGGSK